MLSNLKVTVLSVFKKYIINMYRDIEQFYFICPGDNILYTVYSLTRLKYLGLLLSVEHIKHPHTLCACQLSFFNTKSHAGTNSKMVPVVVTVVAEQV